MLRRKFTKLFLEIHIFALFSMMGRGEWRLNTCQGPIFTIFNNHIFYLLPRYSKSQTSLKSEMKESKLHKHWKTTGLTSLGAAALLWKRFWCSFFYWALHLILNHCRVYWVLQSSFLVAGNLKSFSVGLGAKFLENDHCIHQLNLNKIILF